MSSADTPVFDRSVLPIPDRPYRGKTNRTLAGCEPQYPTPVSAPKGAPNVLLVLIDDAGFGNAATFGGPIASPTLQNLADQGLKYNRFHVTALCSPSRAALLSGRNHHAVGFGSIAECCGGWPGYNATWPKAAASGAEILRQNGYNTAAFGKWHLTPDDQQGPAGPFRRWPNGLGFDYFWGFLGAEASQYDTVITENNTILGPPQDENFYFPDAMADKCIEWMRGQQSQDPDRPFFVYFSTGATHAPHHVASKWADKYKGKFDGGWDALRVQTFERQKKLGVIPPNAELTPRDPAFPAWDSLSADEKTLYARQMEVFAGYQENTDHNVGRVVRAIDEMGIRENTLILYILGDNGASMEGSTTGCFNELTVLNGVPLTPEQQLKFINEVYGGLPVLGSPSTHPHYASAWAWAGNTPFQWGKQVASHFGGTRDPMVVSWPSRIKDKGGLRSQFTHVTDVVPTLLEAAGIPAPRVVNGIEQMPMHGVSFAYTFDDAKSPERHTQQYFEIFGNRAMYKDGWIASCKLDRIPWEFDQKTMMRFAPEVYDTDKDRWELYNVEEDFSQARDLAAKHPEKLAQLKALFWEEAEKYHVTPLLGGLAGFYGFIPTEGAMKKRYRFYSGVQNIGTGMIPHVYGTSYAIEADVVLPQNPQGVIVANADFLGGFALYVQGGKLHHTYSFLGIRSDTLTSVSPLPSGPAMLRFEFIADEAKEGTGGRTRLLVNGKAVAEGRLEQSVPGRFSAYACMDIGRDNKMPVSRTYESPFPFNGTIKTVDFDLEPVSKTTVEKAEIEKVHHRTRVVAGITG